MMMATNKLVLLLLFSVLTALANGAAVESKPISLEIHTMLAADCGSDYTSEQEMHTAAAFELSKEALRQDDGSVSTATISALRKRGFMFASMVVSDAEKCLGKIGYNADLQLLVRADLLQGLRLQKSNFLYTGNYDFVQSRQYENHIQSVMVGICKIHRLTVDDAPSEYARNVVKSELKNLVTGKMLEDIDRERYSYVKPSYDRNPNFPVLHQCAARIGFVGEF